jgi:hypothetical protein
VPPPIKAADKSPVGGSRRASFSQVNGLRESLEIIEDAEEIEEDEDTECMPKLTTQASIIFDTRNNNLSPVVNQKNQPHLLEFASGGNDRWGKNK